VSAAFKSGALNLPPMSFWHAGIFPAQFQINTLVQIFFVIQCIWTGVMGVLVTIDPYFSPINDVGVFVRKPGTKKNNKGSKFFLSLLCAKNDEGLAESSASGQQGKMNAAQMEMSKDDVEEFVYPHQNDEGLAESSVSGQQGNGVQVTPAHASQMETSEDDVEEFVHPNARGAWNVRGGSMFAVTCGALVAGTRETYVVAMVAILWREAYDCVEMYVFSPNWKKVLLYPWMSPIGLMPPLLSFNICNILAMYAILVADDN